MEEINGEWALVGIDRRRLANHLQVLFQETLPSINSSLYVLKIYRCRTCGFVELVDKG